MVDYNIAVPQPYDPSNDIANALRFRAQQQAEAENQLKLQAWQEDRAYQLKQREAAAANALAARAKAADIASIYGNFGTTDRAVGTRGLSATGENMSADPYEYLRNQLLKKGYRGEATDVAEFQNKLLTGKKTQAEIDKTNAETTNFNTANIGKRLDLWKNRAQMVTTPEEAYNLSLEMQNDPVLKDFSHLAGDPQEAAARSAKMFRDNPQGWALSVINLTPEQFVQAHERATAAKQPTPVEVDVGGEKIFVDNNPRSPTFGQKLSSFAKSLTQSEQLTKKKDEWERDHPDYTLQETAQGLIAVNKKDPTDTKAVQLDGQTVMPVDKRSVTNIENYEPANVSAQKNYMENVAKTREALQSAPAVLENIERAKELIPAASKFMGTGGQGLLEATKFLNNRLGTSINTENVKSAEELRSRLFMGVMENLKKMDAQPTGRQQEALQEAIGQLDTDPNALPKVLDILGDALRSKVNVYNKDVTDAESRGVKFPYKPQVDLPAKRGSTTVITPDGKTHTFPTPEAAAQFKKAAGIQ